MTTSPYDTPAWDDADYELLGQGPASSTPANDPQVPAHDVATDGPFPDKAPDSAALGSTAYPAFEEDIDDSYVVGSHYRATEYAAMPGMPGRGVVLLTILVTAGVVGLNFALTTGVTFFFDLCFVVICLVAAIGVRRHDIFVAGVLPPFLYAAAIGSVAIIAPTVILESGGLSKTFTTGLAEHAAALVAGYGVALLTVTGRVVATSRR